MNNTEFYVQLNQTAISSISEFAQFSAQFQNHCKSGIFVRLIGFEDETAYLREMSEMDISLSQNGVGYLRLKSLDVPLSIEQAARYDEMLAANRFPVSFNNPAWNSAISSAFASAVSEFRACEPNLSETILHSFKLKLLARMERFVPQLFLRTDEISLFPKLVTYGAVKKHEYLFLWFLAQLGCDVLCLSPAGDLPPQLGRLLQLSALHMGSCLRAVQIPDKFAAPSPPSESAPPSGGSIRMDASRFRRPERDRKIPSPSPVSESRPPQSAQTPAQATKTLPPPPARPSDSSLAELSYEELAGFAASVVMIRVFNEKNECFKTGSGVFINSRGYVLTNFHVVRHGTYFGIRLEEQENEFYTTELIKYHDINDLALLRVDTPCRPIPVYRGAAELRRGQRVVAIGSPLGLFNSVSDGIISGFRKLDEVSMVQFTAPTSPGSSGGALLDMQGRLIGILTAGFDGQNLNVAVDYKTIAAFARGFL